MSSLTSKCRSVNKHLERMFSKLIGLVKTQPTISKCADEVNLVFPWCERIPLSVETSECFLPVDGSGKRVVKMAFDENIKNYGQRSTSQDAVERH